jgi:transcriptional regulator with XRE-family HTH domain
MNESKLQSVLPELGRVLRIYREKSNRHLGEIAEKAGISISMLSQIERGKVSPSIDTLVMVCRAQDIDIGELFRRLSPDSPVRLHKNGERLKIESNGICYEQLMTTQVSAFPIELFLIEIGAGCSTEMSGGGHEGIEMGYVLQGGAVLTVGSADYRIDEFDSVYFAANLPHRLVNVGRRLFKAVWSISPPHVDYLSIGKSNKQPVHAKYGTLADRR